METEMERLRQQHFQNFADSCNRMRGTHRKASDNLQYCDIPPNLTVELALPKDTLYGRFSLTLRGKSRIGVIFDQRTLSVI